MSRTPSGSHENRLSTIGPDRDQFHWLADKFFHIVDVLLSTGRQIRKTGDAGDVFRPAGNAHAARVWRRRGLRSGLGSHASLDR